MVGVNIGVDFKHKSAEFGFAGVDHAFVGLLGLRMGRDFGKAVEQLPHSEVVEGGPKKDRLQVAAQVGG